MLGISVTEPTLNAHSTDETVISLRMPHHSINGMSGFLINSHLRGFVPQTLLTR